MKVESLLTTRLGSKVAASLVGIPSIRGRGLNLIDRTVYKRLTQRKNDSIPQKAVSDKQQMLHNMASGVDRWISSPHVSRKHVERFLKSFGSLFAINKPLVQKFERTYGFRPPSFLTLSPTKRCNLKCIGCYASSSAESATTLDFDVVNRIVKEQKDIWAANFTVISGGEPLMYKSQGKGILDLVQGHPDTFFLMYTNGTLIDVEAAQRMAELGNITPAVSVEGYEEETDERRGKGTYRRILQAFKNLREAGVFYGISVTATRKNAETILSAEFIDYYFKQIGVHYMWIFQYMPIGRSYTLDLMVTPEQRLEMLKKTRKWMSEKELFIADFWNSATLSNGCISAGRTDGGGYIYIDWNGNVMPCVFNPYTSQNILKVYQAGGNLNDVLMSPLMRKIRLWQENYLTNNKNGHCSNLLVPCPIRDHHKDMREIIDDTNAHPADESAETALHDNQYYVGMCSYGEKVEKLTREIWNKEYLSNNKEYFKITEGTEDRKITV